MRELIERWNRGDRSCLGPIAEACLPFVRDQVRRRLGGALRAKLETGDVVQEALLEFLEYGPRFSVSSENAFRALLARIVESVLSGSHDWFAAKRRDMARERPLSSDTSLGLDAPVATETTPGTALSREESEAWVRFGLELLDPDDRRALILVLWDRLSHEEAGSILGVTAEAARMRVNRATVRLAEVIGRLRRGGSESVLDGGAR